MPTSEGLVEERSRHEEAQEETAASVATLREALDQARAEYTEAEETLIEERRRHEAADEETQASVAELELALEQARDGYSETERVLLQERRRHEEVLGGYELSVAAYRDRVEELEASHREDREALETFREAEAAHSEGQTSAPLKVLFVVHQFLPRHRAGTELYTYYLAKELQRRGHDVHLFFSEIRPEQDQYSLSRGTYEGLPYFEVIHNHHFPDFRHTYMDQEMERLFEGILDEVIDDPQIRCQIYGDLDTSGTTPRPWSSATISCVAASSRSTEESSSFRRCNIPRCR